MSHRPGHLIRLFLCSCRFPTRSHNYLQTFLHETLTRPTDARRTLSCTAHRECREEDHMIDISKPIADTRASLAATRATLARIDRKWRARRADGSVVVHASIVVVLAQEVTK